MKPPWRLTQTQDSHIIGQKSIPGTMQISKRMPPVYVKRYNLPQSMNASIRTSGSKKTTTFP